MSEVQKICCVCGVNVAHAKRVKDAKGRYYCQACYDQAAANKGLNTAAPAGDSAPAVAAAPVVAAPVPVAPPPPPPPAAIATSESGELELAEPILPKKAPADEPKLACASCKKIFPEKQARIEDGEFLCPACFAKRKGGSAGATKQKIAAPAPSDGEVIADVAMSLGKQLLIAAGMAVLILGVCVAISVFWPTSEMRDSESASPMFFAFHGLAYWFGIMVQTFLLIASMIVAAKILGGIDFGSIGMAFAKGMGVTAFMFLSQYAAMQLMPDVGIFLFMAWFGVFFLAFMVVFRIDAFEAMLLSAVNLVINWVAGFALAFLF